MTLPTYNQLMLPLMKLLSEQETAIKLSEATQILSDRSGLSIEELSLMLPSGTKTIFYDRVGWAKTYLVKAGLIQQPKRGFCELTNIGHAIDLSQLSAINNEYLMQFESFAQYKSGDLNTNNQNLKPNSNLLNNSLLEETRTPEEVLQDNAELLKRTIKSDLLKLIKENNPAFFERL